MDALRKKWAASPLRARVLPFVVFLALTGLQGQFGETYRYYGYLAKTLVGAVVLWSVWPFIPEVRWKMSGGAVLTGVGVFIMWVGLPDLFRIMGVNDSILTMDGLMQALGLAKTAAKPEIPDWNPFVFFNGNAALGWSFVVVRILGSSLVVPPMEEMFYRSWLYRYLVNPDFEKVPLNRFGWMPFIVTALFFASTHNEWLAAILCAFAYQGLVLWNNRLGDAMTAHAITNFLLGLWVVWKPAWHFW